MFVKQRTDVLACAQAAQCAPVAVAHGVHVQHAAQQLGVVECCCCLCHAAVALIQQLKQVTT